METLDSCPSYSCPLSSQSQAAAPRGPVGDGAAGADRTSGNGGSPPCPRPRSSHSIPSAVVGGLHARSAFGTHSTAQREWVRGPVFSAGRLLWPWPGVRPLASFPEGVVVSSCWGAGAVPKDLWTPPQWFPHPSLLHPRTWPPGGHSLGLPPRYQLTTRRPGPLRWQLSPTVSLSLPCFLGLGLTPPGSERSGSHLSRPMSAVLPGPRPR